ncbi:hypothetical protein RSOL_175050 [Rhizoctonia solani AG-3 Rhs1AP]|uniref:Uncharacterized protein n=1 Tax=Rhizoctonia solani AG-3 Rhs1AP TaxID=1086054 RepID=X8J209_9AGAM|nr:hypothetical protein RSOL_175050 [Rhizoctonia solani AG-3 Rhs1AP]
MMKMRLELRLPQHQGRSVHCMTYFCYSVIASLDSRTQMIGTQFNIGPTGTSLRKECVLHKRKTTIRSKLNYQNGRAATGTRHSTPIPNITAGWLTRSVPCSLPQYQWFGRTTKLVTDS